MSNPKDHCFRFYKSGTYTFIIGKYKFESVSSIDLWPITKVVENRDNDEDRKLYYAHLHNLYLKNYQKELTDNSKIKKYFGGDKLYMEFINDLFNSDTYDISLSWLKKFIKESNKSKSQIYMPLEKDMPKIGNIDLSEFNYVNVLGSKVPMPIIEDGYFERMYGDWKTPKITHIHIFRYGKMILS